MMNQYQVIARKFRPKLFSQVCGQEEIVQTLRNSIKLNRVSHAYLFCGPRGTGKTTIARILAKALNCSQKESEFEPCDKCESCKEISAGNSLDVLEIDGASNRGIDDVRQINETVHYAPSKGMYKIYIIDEVHMLTKEAFNALLKTLEEPPARVKFFFATTEPHKVLPTISSRCLRFDLSRIDKEKIEKQLQFICNELQVKITSEALSLISEKAEGSLRDAQSMLDQLICYSEEGIDERQAQQALGIVSKETFEKIDEAYNTKNYKDAIDLAQEIFANGIDSTYFVESLIKYYKDILISHYTKPNAKTQIYSKEKCHLILEYLSNVLMQKVLSKRIHLEMVLLKIVQIASTVSIDHIINKLESLQLKPTPSNPAPSKEEIPTPIEEKKEEALPPKEEPRKPLSLENQTRYDTLVRFASVELNGSIKN